ncbi:MAG: hypothetical protein HOQ20_20215 [Bradyrhizobium sp.]|nr:hypothetical protein [Bradyrhizobium sp.]
MDGVDVRILGTSVRRFIARLALLVAVLLMPFGMTPTVGQPTVSPGASMPHCPDPLSRDHRKSGIAECTMACSAALPAVGVAVEEPLAITPARPTIALATILRGILPDISTPPPKVS